jgi:hypothetical protein
MCDVLFSAVTTQRSIRFPPAYECQEELPIPIAPVNVRYGLRATTSHKLLISDDCEGVKLKHRPLDYESLNCCN